MPELFQARKSFYGVSGLELDAAELAMINQYTLRDFTAEELFAFKATACDNEIDRDYEAFTSKTLEQLAVLFVGKAVLDAKHYALPENQCARIYAAEVIKERGKTTSYGEPYVRLEVKAYIPRTESFAELIQLIETGIRKEVSVGCAVMKKVCSICGNPYWSSACEHSLRIEYEGGQKCFIKLEDARDAYEISFVAIPAQPAAGVTKSAAENTSTPYLAELQGVMDSVKSIATSIQKLEKRYSGVPMEQNEAHSPAQTHDNSLDVDAEELIRSAKALYTQYTDEKEYVR